MSKFLDLEMTIKKFDYFPFKIADDAAVDALKYIHDISRFLGVEMGGYIYKNEECYYAQIPTLGTVYGINLGKKLENTVASYHSHPTIINFESFSIIDIDNDEIQGIDGYMINYYGDIIKHIVIGEIVYLISDISIYPYDYYYRAKDIEGEWK